MNISTDEERKIVLNIIESFSNVLIDKEFYFDFSVEFYPTGGFVIKLNDVSDVRGHFVCFNTLNTLDQYIYWGEHDNVKSFEEKIIKKMKKNILNYINNLNNAIKILKF